MLWYRVRTGPFVDNFVRQIIAHWGVFCSHFEAQSEAWMGLHRMSENTEKTDENLDFGRGLFVCESPGHEFVGMRKAGAVIGVLGSQVFAMLLLIPGLGFFVLWNQFGVSLLMTGLVTGATLIVAVAIGLIFLLKLNKMNRKQLPGAFFRKKSDSRYRVRAVIPQKRQGDAIHRWAQLAAYGRIGDGDMVSADELEMVQGGFEPIILQPWFGIKRDRRYWWTVVVMSVVVGVGTLFGLSLFFGSLTDLLQVFGFLGYAVMGLSMVGGVVAGELMWPVYIRLVPGQLDIFRYGFLGSGKPVVERFDLRKVGVCVDFGGYIVSLEPQRPVGEPLPALVMGKRWPNAQVFPEWFAPTYFTSGCSPESARVRAAIDPGGLDRRACA